uniref:Uncharacterized protein n=1 Tax=Tanacetum cinerariifolium TaxID=118510 RepID=A0A6L2NPD6_TANCI|nr:hypothetical protein [Tanacetum cinerariifolium]
MDFSSSSSDSKVSSDSTYSKSCLEIVKLLTSQNEQLLKDLKKSELMVLAYKTGLEPVEERLKFFKTNESVYLEDIKVLKVEIQMKEIAIRELRRKLEIAQKEKDGIQLKVENFENASKSLNKLIDYQIVDNCKKGLWYENYNAVPPPYTGNFMPPKPDLSFTGLNEFVNKHVVENNNARSSKEETKAVRKNDDAPIIKEWVSDNKEENVAQPKIEKKTVRPSIVKKEYDIKIFDADKDLGGEEVFVKQEVVADKEEINEVTLAQALAESKASKPKHKKKDQIRFDEEAAKRLQAEFDEEERLARERTQKEQEANIALIETWYDVQVKINVDY